MPDNKQIQIFFDNPGDWTDYHVTALWFDGPFDLRRECEPRELSAGQRAALARIIGDIVELDAPWRVEHVRAALSADETAVELSVDVRRKSDGAPGVLTPEHLPTLRLDSQEALELFASFFP